jgi:hypothetical protein
VALAAGAFADGLRWAGVRGGWNGPAPEFGVLMIPPLAYAALALVLVAFNLDYEPAPPAKGDLPHLLGLKRRGGLVDRPRRRRTFRAGRLGPPTRRPRVADARPVEDVLGRLVGLKRCGA